MTRSVLSTGAVTRDIAIALGVLGLLGLLAGCSKDGRAAIGSAHGSDDLATPAAPHGDCSHTVCGSNFFVDSTSAGDCAVGATCGVALKLTATGEFHINQDYPYKFKSDDTPGLEFLGTDAAGKTTFSKTAGNWQATDEKSGVLSVAFRPAASGSKTVAGTFKLSVCSAATCQLEQQQVSTTVAVR
jgi:hypothetical protein